MLNERISKHFCIRFTEDDARIAIPMMVVSILMLAVIVCL